MKRLIAIAALASLAACAEPDADTTADAADTDTAATTEADEVMAADGQPTPGFYRVTLEDGTVLMEELKPDGTFVQTDEAGEVGETGTWVQKSPGEFCWTADAEYVDEDTPAEEQCNTETVGDDGVWTSTNSEGEVATIERVEA